MAVNYDDIFKKEYETALGDSVTRLQQSQEQQEKALKAGYDQQQADLLANRNKALKEAYISKMKEERDMPSAMARQGLNGGMAESNIASINRAYQNNRNAAETNYNNNKTTLGVGYEGDLANIRSQYVDAIATARQNANSLALTAAQQKYNNLLAEEERLKAEEEAKKAEEEARKKAAAAAASTLTTPTPEPEKKNNNSALANQSGLASTSGTTQRDINSGTYKSYDYQEKWINGKKYIYKYGVKNDNSKVFLGMSRA